MKNMEIIRFLIISIGLLFSFSGSSWAEVVSSAKPKVLVVMSYDLDLPWSFQIKEGIDSILKDRCELKYFTMNTKKNLAKGSEKALEAYHLYQEWMPDGVIAVDDNAQAMFVVPYLKDKVRTPIMFCGVNFDVAKYGYPSDHISGIVERYLLRETFEFACSLQPDAKTIAFLSKESPTAVSIMKQIDSEKAGFPLEVVGFYQVKELDKALALVALLRNQCDVLFVDSVQGLVDAEGRPVTEQESIVRIVDTFGKVTVSSSSARVEFGVLCSVAQVGQEQGVVAAEKLLEAFEGVPVSAIPVSGNRFGQRTLNVDTMKKLGINITPTVIRNTQLVGKNTGNFSE